MSHKVRYIYVAGPISKGDQIRNCSEAIKVGDHLLKLGLVPFIPHLSIAWHMITPVEYEDFMKWDFAWIDKCDALLRLPGESHGADREVDYVKLQKKPVFHSIKEILDYNQTKANTR